MTWFDALRDGGGMLLSAGLVATFLKLLLDGQIVLKREWDRLVAQTDELLKENKQHVIDFQEQTDRTIEAQSQLIESLRKGGNE